MRRAAGWEPDWFEVESFRVITDDRRGVDDAHRRDAGDVTTEATVKVHVGGERRIATAEGNGPVNALDRALRNALNGRFPALDRVHLTDYKVRVLDTQQGHRRGHARADRLDRRRRDLDHDRRQREHHRGVVAGPARLDPVRAPARRTGAGREGTPSSVGACRPIRSSRPIPPTGPASSRTCRPARRCRRRRRWRADRPGDLGPAQPRGRPVRLARSQRRLRVHARRARRRSLAARRTRGRPRRHAGARRDRRARAAFFGRAPVIHDVDLAMSCSATTAAPIRRVRRARELLVHEAGHVLPAPRDRRHGARALLRPAAG